MAHRQMETFNSMKYFQLLKKAGIPENQANLQVEMLQEASKNGLEHLASREELLHTKIEIKEDIGNVRSELASTKAELGNTKIELKEDIANVRSELASTKAELKEDIANVKTSINTAKWQTILTVVVLSLPTFLKHIGIGI